MYLNSKAESTREGDVEGRIPQDHERSYMRCSYFNRIVRQRGEDPYRYRSIDREAREQQPEGDKEGAKTMRFWIRRVAEGVVPEAREKSCAVCPVVDEVWNLTGLARKRKREIYIIY